MGGYLILIGLIVVAFFIGFIIGSRKVKQDFERFVDERRNNDQTAKKVADVLKKNRDLMEKIRLRLNNEN